MVLRTRDMDAPSPVFTWVHIKAHMEKQSPHGEQPFSNLLATEQWSWIPSESWQGVRVTGIPLLSPGGLQD